MMKCCFNAYDVRGRFKSELDEDFATALGMAVCDVFNVRTAVIGRDARLSGIELSGALSAGFCSKCACVTDIGMCGTEEIYYATSTRNFDVGVMVTGSHNPANENGFKIVTRGAIPVSSDSGLLEIKDRVSDILGKHAMPKMTPKFGAIIPASFRKDYVDWLMNLCSFMNIKETARPLKIVVDAGNGCAGLVLSELMARLPVDFVCRELVPDGTFPNGVPNPLLADRRLKTSLAVIESKSDLGIAWDGDFDRCFFYDENGNFIDGYYCVGLLAEQLLKKYPGGKIVHDPRVYWNTQDMVKSAGGVPVLNKTGHAFMKERMRLENAVYGGEMSSHHYFKDFSYCDSGMIPWLIVISMLQNSGKTMSELVEDRMMAYPCSGEINTQVNDPRAIMSFVRDRYAKKAVYEDQIDGVNLELKDWRFNLRRSNTEPLLRLNVEARGNKNLLVDKTDEILQLIAKLDDDFAK